MTISKTAFFECFFTQPRLQTHDVGLFPFILQLVRHFGGLETTGPEPIVINGVTWVAPINGRKQMGFPGVVSPL